MACDAIKVFAIFFKTTFFFFPFSCNLAATSIDRDQDRSQRIVTSMLLILATHRQENDLKTILATVQDTTDCRRPVPRPNIGNALTHQ
jgi:hypothetical protein